VPPGTTLNVSIFNPDTHQYQLSEFVATVDASGRFAWVDVTHFTIFAVSVPQKVMIASINPTIASPGDVVTIYGSGFGLAPEENIVRFLGRTGPAITVTVISASANVLTVRVPAGAGNGGLFVTVGTAKSNTVRFNVNDSSDENGPSNLPPNVYAGIDQTISLPSSALLQGAVSDDGLPSGVVTTQWSVVSGPGSVSFDNPAALTAYASFSATGTFVLRLTANDGALSASDDVVVTVNVPSPHNPPANKAPSVNA